MFLVFTSISFFFSSFGYILANRNITAKTLFKTSDQKKLDHSYHHSVRISDANIVSSLLRIGAKIILITSCVAIKSLRKFKYLLFVLLIDSHIRKKEIRKLFKMHVKEMKCEKEHRLTLYNRMLMVCLPVA